MTKPVLPVTMQNEIDRFKEIFKEKEEHNKKRDPNLFQFMLDTEIDKLNEKKFFPRGDGKSMTHLIDFMEKQQK